MLYSKARITLTSGGATTTNLTLRSDASGDALLKAQPLFLPSLLGYDISGRMATANSAAAAAGNEDGGFVAMGPLGGSIGHSAATQAAASLAEDSNAEPESTAPAAKQRSSTTRAAK